MGPKSLSFQKQTIPMKTSGMFGGLLRLKRTLGLMQELLVRADLLVSGVCVSEFGELVAFIIF